MISKFDEQDMGRADRGKNRIWQVAWKQEGKGNMLLWQKGFGPASAVTLP